MTLSGSSGDILTLGVNNTVTVSSNLALSKINAIDTSHDYLIVSKKDEN